AGVEQAARVQPRAIPGRDHLVSLGIAVTVPARPAEDVTVELLCPRRVVRADLEPRDAVVPCHVSLQCLSRDLSRDNHSSWPRRQPPVGLSCRLPPFLTLVRSAASVRLGCAGEYEPDCQLVTARGDRSR